MLGCGTGCNTYFTQCGIEYWPSRLRPVQRMQFHVSSYRHGFELLNEAGAVDEIESALASITIESINAKRRERQKARDERAGEGKARKAGIQIDLNAELERLLTDPNRAWRSQAPLYTADHVSRKGHWTMDFHKVFRDEFGVGIEVTFNHAEALSWTLIRPALAYQSEDVLTEARIEAGAIIIGTDNLKGNRRTEGGLRMDGAVGTYERLLALLPRLKWVIPVPLAIFGLDWSDGEMVGKPYRINLHGPLPALPDEGDE